MRRYLLNGSDTCERAMLYRPYVFECGAFNEASVGAKRPVRNVVILHLVVGIHAVHCST